MTRISLQTLDQVLAAQLRATQSGVPAGGQLSRLSPGEIIQAQVLKSFGSGLFEIGIGGKGVVTSSNTPLTPGQVLTLQVSRNGPGPPSLRVLTLADGAIAEVASKASLEALEQNQPSQVLARLVQTNTPGASGDTGLTLELQLPATSDETTTQQQSIQLSSRLAALIKSDGPIGRLLTLRPDLASQVQKLLESYQQQPEGLGSNIELLTRQLEQLGRSQPPAGQAALATASNKLSSQLFSSQLFEQPETLAQVLADRLGPLARGFEGTIAKLAAASESLTTLNDPTAANLPIASLVADTPAAAFKGLNLPSDAEAALLEVALSSSDLEASTHANSNPSLSSSTESSASKGALAASGTTHNASTDASATAARVASEVGNPASSVPSDGRIVQGTLDSDLKGQLLELRSQLTDIAAQTGAPTPAVTQAIAQTDVLLNQLTAQQIRNMDGLNQYMHIDLPVSPKGGVDAARMQVFYRKRGPGQPQDASEDRFTVALFLGMSKLGQVMAVVTKVDQSISVGFTVNNRQTKDLLSGQSDGLREALLAAGHSGATVTVRQAEPKTNSSNKASNSTDVWDEFLSAMPPEGSPGRRLNVRA